MVGAQYALGENAAVVIEEIDAAIKKTHSQQALAEYFLCMKIGRGTLLQEGLLELQLSA